MAATIEKGGLAVLSSVILAASFDHQRGETGEVVVSCGKGERVASPPVSRILLHLSFRMGRSQPPGRVKPDTWTSPDMALRSDCGEAPLILGQSRIPGDIAHGDGWDSLA